MKILGTWPGHDCSFCVLDNGVPTIHAELERYNREKSPQGDAVSFAREILKDEFSDVTHFASAYPTQKTKQYDSYSEAVSISQENGGDFHFISHHKAHAAHAFYSSNLSSSIVMTLDGGGVEDDNGQETASTVWVGDNLDLKHVHTFHPAQMNIGGVWTRVTRYVFKLQNGWPLGGQEGTVMAMAALGDSQKYHDDFYKMLTVDVLAAGFKPPTQPKGAYVPGKDPTHPYLDRWARIADQSDQDKYDLAAYFQSATERLVKDFIGSVLEKIPLRSICIAGGVALNSVCMGKIKGWFPGRLDEVYIPPVPYDGGLCLGAAQYQWHAVLRNPRIQWKDNFLPYLGEVWDAASVEAALSSLPENVTRRHATDATVVDLLADGKIVSVFNSRSESGRRALGNRSIIADPRSAEMKDRVNLKVKHRQWFRPFAPSILADHVDEWFENPQNSPYMQFVIPFKDSAKSKVPAVVHFDGTARLQTVHKHDNPWYYGFIKRWHEKSGVPIVLNTSFNDREPICENPKHAVDCFLGTEIDFLYFPEFSIILEKRSN
jgi:carbamoyltransferase